MRRIVFSFVVFLMSASLFAELKQVDYRGMQLTAQKGAVREVSISPIISTSLDSEVGMPFDLESDSVEYSNADGAVTGKRQIATWSLYSNSPKPYIEITAEPLTHTDGTEIPYSLSFYYQFSIGENQMEQGNLIVESGKTTTSESASWNKHEEAVVNFTNRPVRLMLDNVDVSSDAYPAGSYRADVIVEIYGE